MVGHRDSYKLANAKMNEMKNEFTVLVKTSNLGQEIYSGAGRRMQFADEDKPFIFPSKII